MNQANYNSNYKINMYPLVVSANVDGDQNEINLEFRNIGYKESRFPNSSKTYKIHGQKKYLKFQLKSCRAACESDYIIDVTRKFKLPGSRKTVHSSSHSKSTH